MEPRDFERVILSTCAGVSPAVREPSLLPLGRVHLDRSLPVCPDRSARLSRGGIPQRHLAQTLRGFSNPTRPSLPQPPLPRKEMTAPGRRGIVPKPTSSGPTPDKGVPEKRDVDRKEPFDKFGL